MLRSGRAYGFIQRRTAPKQSAPDVAFRAVSRGFEGLDRQRSPSGIVTPAARRFRRLGWFVHSRFVVDRRTGLGKQRRVASSAIFFRPLRMSRVMKRHVTHF